MIINIEVKNRVATYRSLGSDPVCGSNNDTVKFHFDEEWNNVATKTARFVWGGCYYDQEFEGDSCPVPLLLNLTRIWIGVYAGEPVDGEPAWATTKAEVPYQLSARCGYETAHPESGVDYTNEAKGYAMEAQASATLASNAADRSEEYLAQAKEEVSNMGDMVADAYGMEEVARLTLRLYLREVTNEDGLYTNALTFAEGMIDPNNGSVLLSYMGEEVLEPVYHSQTSAVMRLMRCPVTRFIMEHSNPNEVLTYRTVFDGRAAGECWKGVEWGYGENDCRLYDTEWPIEGPRLVVADNVSSPSIGVGPSAVFLQFPRAVQQAIQQSGLMPDTSSDYLTCTIIGYQ